LPNLASRAHLGSLVPSQLALLAPTCLWSCPLLAQFRTKVPRPSHVVQGGRHQQHL